MHRVMHFTSSMVFIHSFTLKLSKLLKMVKTVKIVEKKSTVSKLVNIVKKNNLQKLSKKKQHCQTCLKSLVSAKGWSYVPANDLSYVSKGLTHGLSDKVTYRAARLSSGQQQIAKKTKPPVLCCILLSQYSAPNCVAYTQLVYHFITLTL